MTGHQVIIFGSFTEEEARSMQCPQQQGHLEIMFGSLDLVTLKSVGIFDAGLTNLHPKEKYEQLNSASKTIVLPTSKFLEEENDFLGSASSTDSSTKELEQCHAEKNSSIGSSSAASSLKLTSVKEPRPSSSGELSLSGNDDVTYSMNGISKGVSNKSIVDGSNVFNAVIRNFTPRGLINLGNLCFLNATLQALLSCCPFFDLLQDLRCLKIPEIGYPTLRAFVEFISYFDVLSDSICGSNGKAVMETASPFHPIMFDSILKIFTPDISDNLSGRPRQEDAQEFLSFVMHQMHDELLKLDGQISNGSGKIASIVSSTDEESQEDEWETVGPRKKTAITRTQSFIPSKLSAIFGGQLRSVVKARGSKASATIQPFLLLHLNIFPDPVRTIEDALQWFSAPETLEGYQTLSSGKAETVSASKSVKILELPEIMILHLMRFSYGSQGSTKLHKAVHFPLDLVLGHDILSSRSSEARRYQLVATITHHGRDPSKGHYTADARHPNGDWMHYDDASVTLIPESKVLHDQAYVLFYKRV